MKKVLILGAGLVSRPGVTYLLESDNLDITVASRTLSKAEKLVEGFSNGHALQLNVDDRQALTDLIGSHDIIVSLLPWIHHVTVATLCLQENKHMVTTSYVSGDMKKLDDDARKKDLLFLNEIGVDPGIDHMSAMKIIDEVHEAGGKVLDFYSFCGGLPAPDDNDNPFGYKFSWSPKGVVLASRNSALYLENGKTVDVEGKDLFLDVREEDIEGLGRFEVYPNRDSMPYKDLYGLKDARTVMRGTYRNIGWCETFKKIVDLGLVDETPVENLKGSTYRKMMADLIGAGESDDIKQLTARKAGLSADSEVISRLEWLGLFSDEIVPDVDNRLDVLSQRLQEKLYYKDGERDMIILKHTFIIQNRDGSKDKMTSTLIDYGIPNGDSSMARTVSLPMAVGVKLLAEDKLAVRGVQIPLKKEVYELVLEELARLGIEMEEVRTPLG